jgi:hypothetical protein
MSPFLNSWPCPETAKRHAFLYALRDALSSNPMFLELSMYKTVGNLEWPIDSARHSESEWGQSGSASRQWPQEDKVRPCPLEPQTD